MLKKIYKFFTIFIYIALFLFGSLVAFSIFPISGNIKLLTVRSGSMEPSIDTGSLIFIKPVDDYQIGDIVTRATEEANVSVTHRITKKEMIDGKNVYETKGDANNIADNDTVMEESIMGKVIWDIPYLGYPVGYAKTTKGLFIVIIIPALLIVIDEMFKIQNEIAKKIDYKKRVNKRSEENLNIQNEDEKEI